MVTIKLLPIIHRNNELKTCRADLIDTFNKAWVIWYAEGWN